MISLARAPADGAGQVLRGRRRPADRCRRVTSGRAKRAVAGVYRPNTQASRASPQAAAEGSTVDRGQDGRRGSRRGRALHAARTRRVWGAARSSSLACRLRSLRSPAAAQNALAPRRSGNDAADHVDGRSEVSRRPPSGRVPIRVFIALATSGRSPARQPGGRDGLGLVALPERISFRSRTDISAPLPLESAIRGRGSVRPAASWPFPLARYYASWIVLAETWCRPAIPWVDRYRWRAGCP
jgi:hypothetical protein